MAESPKVRVSVAGATGYAGAELTALLASHPNAEIATLHGSARGETVPFERVHAALAGKSGPAVEPFAMDRLLDSRPDCVFLATPNETSAELAPALVASGKRVVDLSGSFRLKDAAEFERWYGFPHPDPALLETAVYGLTEWCNGELRAGRLVANPGCYPTSILLALRPLLPILEPGRAIVCDGKSGVSGAGKKSDVSFSFAELAGNFKAYGVGAHRHEPEIRQGLSLGDDAPLVFVPHLLPIVRGILSTLYVGFSSPMTPERLSAIYDDAYARAPFVRVRPHGDLPDLRAVVGTPRAEIGYRLLEGGRSAVVVSVIDNLLKGAASQAVQNFNRMYGFDETAGLA